MLHEKLLAWVSLAGSRGAVGHADYWQFQLERDIGSSPDAIDDTGPGVPPCHCRHILFPLTMMNRRGSL